VKLHLWWYATEYLSSMGWVGLGYENWPCLTWIATTKRLQFSAAVSVGRQFPDRVSSA